MTGDDCGMVREDGWGGEKYHTLRNECLDRAGGMSALALARVGMWLVVWLLLLVWLYVPWFASPKSC